MAWTKAAVRLVRVVVVLACVAKVTKASRGRKPAPAGGSDDPWSAGPPAGSAPAADDEPRSANATSFGLVRGANMASGSLTVQEERDGHSPEPRKRPRESGRQEAVPDGRALCGICGGEMNVIHGPATIAPPVPACTTGGAVAEADRNIATAFLAGCVVRDLALVNHALKLADHRQRSGQMLADAG